MPVVVQYTSDKRADLTRVGFVSGSNSDGSTVVILPYEEDWDANNDALCRNVLQAGLLAAGVSTEVISPEEYNERLHRAVLGEE